MVHHAPEHAPTRLSRLPRRFNLKFTSKQLVRQSHKCEKEEKAEKLKVKKANP